jgi:quercetin dioxygenase-like cupin family protein
MTSTMPRAVKHPRPVKAPRLLSTRGHAVFRLAPGLLLVFKPRGHREETHAHPYRQRLQVLRGQLIVRTEERAITLRPRSQPLLLEAGRVHGTFAAADTWLIAEALSKR